ncbi:hypothetical protein C9374_000297 [Naegleria lovaniensis]|uniref:Transmembrane protein n=1 Tax=Naegleria lovaniensis TaxID=51637 RepID=A0AA88H079_NAELO|nr:uncharacterized protein C9374_000297 [Naegleria lovaniensis]KAG2388858.1 hypothetical protein C9374_000297 [Naegleria lovaniensis]
MCSSEKRPTVVMMKTLMKYMIVEIIFCFFLLVVHDDHPFNRSFVFAISSSRRDPATGFELKQTPAPVNDTLQTEHLTQLSQFFNNCWDVTRYMSDQNWFIAAIGTEQWFPSSFGCSNVSLWTKYGVNRLFEATQQPLRYYSFIYFEKRGESYDLCSKVGYWEMKLKLACGELLCENDHVDNLSAYVEEITQKQTNIFDWINYCQYCSRNNTLRSHQQKLGPTRGCFPKDQTVSDMINKFPQSLGYCGNIELGIPIVVNSSDVEPRGILNFPYSYICYCRSNITAIKCDYNVAQFVSIQTISFGAFSIHAISFFVTLFFTFLPKLKSSIRQKKSVRFVTIATVLETELVLAVAFLLSATWGTNIATTIFGNIAISCVFFTLFAWVAYWFRLVLYVKTKKTKPAILLYVGLVLLSLTVGIVVPSIVTRAKALSEIVEFFTYYIFALSVLALIMFVLSSVWIYWAMKKVSDVNMLNTSFLRFVIYSSTSILVFSIGYFIITQISGGFFIGIISGIFSIVTHTTIASITLGITYMEFEKEDFMEFYSCCYLKGKTSAAVSTTLSFDKNSSNTTSSEQEQHDTGATSSNTYYSKISD